MFFYVSRAISFNPLSTFVCLLVSLSLPVAALPNEARNHTFTKRSPKPPFPTEEDCNKAVNPGQPPPHTAVFWTGFPSNQAEWLNYRHELQGWAVANELTTWTNPRVWNPPNFWDMDQYEGDKLTKARFIQNTLMALASRVQGTVFLVMPYGTAPWDQSWFWKYEWPALRDGGKVTEIMWLDANALNTPAGLPHPFSVGNVWWRKGDPQPATYPGSDAPPASMPAPRPNSTPTPSPRAQKLLKGRLSDGGRTH